jgi:hypothetical protein
MVSKWIEDLASGFWETVGFQEPFPRSLEQAILAWSKPVLIVKLPRLCPLVMREWLQRRRLTYPLITSDRCLNGCMFAHQGTGFLFVEGSLAADDVRMIVAHEFAHYLAEYDYPRERARRRIGESLLPIYDGLRSATDSEKLQAALAGVELGTHVHYMERNQDSSYPEPVSQVERTANELALELVAPWVAVFAELRVVGQLPTDVDQWKTVLQRRFGLPSSWAGPYARRLIGQARRRRTFSETLGL